MTDRQYGGFWRRYIAYLIDKIVLYLVSLFLIVVGSIALGKSGISLGRILATGDLPRGLGLFAILYGVTMFVTDMIYYTWFHGSVGQTPGKMLLGLRVIQASGEKMTFGIAFLRWVGSLVSGLFLWLGYLWIAVDWRKQGWHDKIAATLVVRAGSEPADCSLPAAAALRSPEPPPTSQPPTDAAPLPPPSVPASDTDRPAGTSASNTDRPGETTAVLPPAGRDAGGPAGDVPGDPPGRG